MTAEKPLPEFSSVPARPGWWAKIAVDNPIGIPKAPEYVYDPVALWLVYFDDVIGGLVIDAPQRGVDTENCGRISQIRGFAGFVYEPARTET